MGIEPMTPVLPRLCATSAPHGPTLPYSYTLSILKIQKIQSTYVCTGGQWRIRTSEALAIDLQSIPFVHFGNCPGCRTRQFVLSDRRVPL
jgi:hypothetical protein